MTVVDVLDQQNYEYLKSKGFSDDQIWKARFKALGIYEFLTRHNQPSPLLTDMAIWILEDVEEDIKQMMEECTDASRYYGSSQEER